ncbi:unnamed protein product, partial [Rotaria sordida]
MAYTSVNSNKSPVFDNSERRSPSIVNLPPTSSHSNSTSFTMRNGNIMKRDTSDVDHLTKLLMKSMNSSNEPNFFGMCARCNDEIVGEENGLVAMDRMYHVLHILRATGKPYHAECFCCIVCHKSLDGVTFTIDAIMKVHCIDCFHQNFAPRRYVRHRPILPMNGQEETIRIAGLDRSYHVDCYRCENCKVQFTNEEGCYSVDDHILCIHCNCIIQERCLVIHNFPTAPCGYEAININIIKRNINSIRKLPKLTKKKKETDSKRTEISGELFQSTLAMLVHEALKKKRRAKSQKIARQTDEFKTEDNKRRAEAHKIARQTDEFKTEDNKRRAEAHKIERQTDEFKTEDNKRRAEAHKTERQNDEFKTEENKKRAEALKIKREEEEYKEEERRRNALRMQNNRDKYKNNFDVMKSNYELKIKEGPTHICSCCGGLWFEYSVREFTVEMLTNKGLKKEFIDTVCYLKNTIIKLCVTCRKDIMLNKVPNLCLSNGLAFYEIPDCLKTLTELEERLISPRIPFMVIRSLGYSKQFGLKGNLVNVPMNIDTNVSILPRTFSDTQTIQLKLMRQMKNKNAFMYETIRPKVVHTAVKYLVEQELYKDEGIVISNDWLNQHFSETENFIVNDEDKKINENENTKGSDDDDNWNECDDEPINPGATETLLNDEIADQNDTGIKFAPAENNRPISILMDLKVDELTFPKIYCGKQRKIKENTKLTYAKIAKNDPVTCVRYFEHRLKFLWEILSAPYGPFQGYELEDKYVRVEFQVRGSPHVHALIWLKNAPKYDKNKPESIKECTEFIDKLISVNSQEAVYHILSIPLSISSRSTVFINTNTPENRISMLKSDKILEILEPDSKDVFVEGLIDMYINRPDEMKNVCLADFASLYNISKKKTGYTEIIENSSHL